MAERVPHQSFRSTTSSRHPGAKFEGIIQSQRCRIEQCARCGGWWLNYVGDDRHAETIVVLDDVRMRLNCLGEPVDENGRTIE